MEPTFNDDAAVGDEHADDIRDKLSAYARFFQRHGDLLPLLTTIRFEMRPTGGWTLDAFVRIAQDTFPEWPERVVQVVSTEEAERNRQVWVLLEDALRGYPALERVEFVLYGRDRERLTEEAKDGLGNALERRLPGLWSIGVVQLEFEEFVNRPLY